MTKLEKIKKLMEEINKCQHIVEEDSEKLAVANNNLEKESHNKITLDPGGNELKLIVNFDKEFMQIRSDNNKLDNTAYNIQLTYKQFADLTKILYDYIHENV